MLLFTGSDKITDKNLEFGMDGQKVIRTGSAFTGMHFPASK
jgi:hypothetical protein